MAIQRNKRNEAMLEDVPRLIFRNFAGRGSKFNREGDRNFGALLRPEWVEEMQKDGWNVKFLQPREEGDEPAPWLPVKVNMDSDFPPEVILITDRGRTTLDAETVEMVDHADITHVDLVLNPYHYNVNGNEGVAAYLVRAYITIEEDAFERKYNNVPSGHSPVRFVEEFGE